jgi:hypothetical protein
MPHIEAYPIHPYHPWLLHLRDIGYSIHRWVVYIGHHFINILLLFLAPFHFQHVVVHSLLFQYLILNLLVLLLLVLPAFLLPLLPVICWGEHLVCRQK